MNFAANIRDVSGIAVKVLRSKVRGYRHSKVRKILHKPTGIPVSLYIVDIYQRNFQQIGYS